MEKQNLREDILIRPFSQTSSLNCSVNDVTHQKGRVLGLLKILLEPAHWEKMARNIFILYKYRTTTMSFDIFEQSLLNPKVHSSVLINMVTEQLEENRPPSNIAQIKQNISEPSTALADGLFFSLLLNWCHRQLT